MPTTPHNRRELAHRTTGGLEITLHWHPQTDRTSITVHQPATWQTITFPVQRELALHAFHHPFAHLPLHDTNQAAPHQPHHSSQARTHR
jgi:hypothetical protein